MMIRAPAWLAWPETQTLMRAFEKHSDQVRFVGGAVRDALLDKTVQDIDLATSLKPEQAMGVLKAAGVTVIPTGLKHGTITAKIAKRHFEITTLRRDTVCDGRHATVEYTDDWKEDALRRDFTMNALYMDFSGEVMDYTGGIGDAKSGHVKFIGDAEARIKEDYLRILRFFRFFAYYGKTPADENALMACARNATGIEQLSGERIQHEMFKLLASENPYPALRLMEKANVLSAIFDGKTSNVASLEGLQGVESALGEQAESETRLALMLDVSSIPSICTLWRLSGTSREMLEVIHTHLPVMEEVANNLAGQKKLLRKLGITPFRQLVLAASVLCDKLSLTQAQAIFALTHNWTPPEFPVSGKILKAHGIEEGVVMGKTLKALEQAWEESDYTLTKEALLRAASMPPT
ncbi:MAG: CCA tRNA nucleotidyltransferase [Alphaproteobacteria bacterium]